MLIVYPDGDPSNVGKYIRPTPFISISQNVLRNKLGKMGSTYDITLNGTIVTKRLSGLNSLSPADEYNDPINSGSNLKEKLPEILARQHELRSIFSTSNVIYVEVLDIDADEPKIGFYAKVQSINFEEGIWVDTCKYTVNLTADYILDKKNRVTGDGIPTSGICPIPVPTSGEKFIQEILHNVAGLVEDFNDTWSIETDESSGSIVNGKFIPRSYRLTRNMTATGRDIYPRSKQAWEHARDFIKRNIESSGDNSLYGSGAYIPFLRKSFLGIPSGYIGYNHVRSENIDKAAGSYSVSDSWILAGSGDNALESYNLSIQSTSDNPFVSVSIDGNIKGLSSIPASGYLPVLDPNVPNSYNPPNITTPYNNALQKYFKISNSGQFGIGSDVYKRANNSVPQNLNSQPRSISLGTNEVNGEITYSLQFDNRPTNYFSSVLSENVTISDTYPGDVFAVIPVIGRKTGPILQYIGGRTEYRRDVNIEIRLDHTDLGYNNNRRDLMLTKPSINEPVRSELNELIRIVSPASEPGIRKYFLSPPAENWSPKEGIYSLSLSWVYELDR